MADLPDSQQSFGEMWTSSFPSNEEVLFSELGDIHEVAKESTLNLQEGLLDELFPDIAEITQSNELVDVPLETDTDQVNFSDSPKEFSSLVPAQETVTNPCSTNLHWRYGFELNFGEQSYTVTKSTNFVHSAILNKLFVRINQICPVQFRFAVHPPTGCTIRVVPMFKNSEHASKLVTPCLHHRKGSEIFPNPGFHLIHAEMPSAYNVTYSFNAEGRETVSCSCDGDYSNMENFILCYKFTCLSSCQSGINRRPVVLVFTLEDVNGEILGRQSVNICICACPGRDRVREEERQTQSKPSRKMKRPFPSTCVDASSNIAVKKDCHISSDDETFVMTIRGRKKYEKLLAIKQALDLEELVTPEQRKQYFSKENS